MPEPADAPITTAAVTGADATPRPTLSTSEFPSTTAPTLPTSQSPPSRVAPSEASTADRSVAPPPTVVRVTAVEVRADEGSEQIVVHTAGGVPGWAVRYVDVVRVDGEPVLVDGTAALELVLDAADPAGEQGLADEVAVDLAPEQPLIRELRFAQYLGDQVVFAAGLARQVPFSVSTTPTSLVVTFHG